MLFVQIDGVRQNANTFHADEKAEKFGFQLVARAKARSKHKIVKITIFNEERFGNLQTTCSLFDGRNF